MVCGDFNEIMYAFKKKRGFSREERRIQLFRGVLNECHLEDLGYSLAGKFSRNKYPGAIRSRCDQ